MELLLPSSTSSPGHSSDVYLKTPLFVNIFLFPHTSSDSFCPHPTIVSQGILASISFPPPLFQHVSSVGALFYGVEPSQLSPRKAIMVAVRCGLFVFLVPPCRKPVLPSFPPLRHSVTLVQFFFPRIEDSHSPLLLFTPLPSYVSEMFSPNSSYFNCFNRILISLISRSFFPSSLPFPVHPILKRFFIASALFFLQMQHLAFHYVLWIFPFISFLILLTSPTLFPSLVLAPSTFLKMLSLVP